MVRFVEELGLDWLTPIAWDASEVYVGGKGEVATLPAAAIVQRAYAAVDFSCQLTDERAGMRRFSGRCGTESLSCVLLEAHSHKGRRIRGRELNLEWLSGQRPAISGGEAVWQGRRWPVFFDEPCLYFESSKLLIIEGRLAGAGPAACLAEYRKWAAETGLADDRTYEPDLAGDAGFADRDFVATVQDRSPFATLTVRRRDAG